MPHVFISYIRENESEVDALAEGLREKGIGVWLDRVGKRGQVQLLTFEDGWANRQATVCPALLAQVCAMPYP